MNKQKVFLSYCHDNQAEAAKLRDDLLEAGYNVWWDKDILVGGDWKYEIRKAMKQSCAVVICLSTELQVRYKSGVYPELLDAIKVYRQQAPGNVFLIPVRFSDCEIPDIEIDDTRNLDSLVYEDLFPETHRSEGLKRLLQALSNAKDDASDNVNLKPPKQVINSSLTFKKPTFKRYFLLLIISSIATLLFSWFYSLPVCMHGLVFISGNSSNNIKDFCMGKHEVTSSEYAEYAMGANLIDKEKVVRTQMPIRDITYEDAESYCQWLSINSGLTIRLPTKIEWIYACRKHGGKFPWGNSDKDAEDYAQFLQARNAPSLVATKNSTGVGFYDMAGNVWEWIKDTNASDELLPTGKNWIIGGSFRSGIEDIKCDSTLPANHDGDKDIGFRVAQEISTSLIERIRTKIQIIFMNK